MTDDTRSRPSRNSEPGRTPYAWHFRKLMDVFEDILKSVKSIEQALVRQDVTEERK